MGAGLQLLHGTDACCGKKLDEFINHIMWIIVLKEELELTKSIPICVWMLQVRQGSVEYNRDIVLHRSVCLVSEPVAVQVCRDVVLEVG